MLEQHTSNYHSSLQLISDFDSFHIQKRCTQAQAFTVAIREVHVHKLSYENIVPLFLPERFSRVFFPG